MENIKFGAKVVEKGTNEKGKFVLLDGTEFYPDGKGGQIGDRGKIGDSNVLYVSEENGKIVHYVDEFPTFEKVVCEIDGERRAEISALHTAQHILSAVLLKEFDTETVAFHMSENACTIDVQNNSLQINFDKVEALVNSVVFSDIPVKKYFVSEEELKKLNIRKKHDVHGKIRIVEIPGVDISLCGGTHVEKTGEIGLVKIVKTEKVKKQFLRIYFTARMRTLKLFQEKLSILKELSKMLTSGDSELVSKIQKMSGEIKSLKKENKILKQFFLKGIISEMLLKGEKFTEKSVNLKKLDFMSLIAMLSREKTDKVFLVYSGESFLIGLAKGANCTLNFNDLFKNFFEERRGKGILKKDFLFAEFSSAEDFNWAKQLLSQKISSLL